MTGYDPLNTLKPVAADLWIVDGPVIRFYGIPFPTRMTVVRLATGDLWLHSPIAPDPALVAALAGLGPVRHLVAPNWIHYAFLPAWQARVPGALTWAAPGVEDRAASRGVALRIDRNLPDAQADWGGAIDHALIAGSDLHREIAFFHRPSRSLILTDLIENFERRAVPPWMLPFLMLAGNLDPDGKAPVDMRLSFRKGRAALRDSIATMRGWNPARILLAHGRWYPENGAAELERAFRWALR